MAKKALRETVAKLGRLGKLRAAWKHPRPSKMANLANLPKFSTQGPLAK